MKKLLAILLCLQSVFPVCFVHGDGGSKNNAPTMQELFQSGQIDYDLISLIGRIAQALQVIKHEESRNLLVYVLSNPQAFGDEEIMEQVELICNRADLLCSLNEIKDNINDDKMLELVLSWLEDELKLDDPEVRELADKMIRRVSNCNLLEALWEDVHDVATQNLITTWLSDPTVLDDREVLVQIRVIERRIKLAKKLSSIKTYIKDAQTIALVEKWLSKEYLLDDDVAANNAKVIIERMLVYKELVKLESKIRDAATKEEVNKWLNNQKLLDDPAVVQMVLVLAFRIKLIEDLEKIIDKIKDSETREKVHSWLANTPKLDNMFVQQQVEQIAQRVMVIEGLEGIQAKIKSEELKQQVANWLANPTLLDDPQEAQKAQMLIEKITQEQLKILGKTIGKIKDGSLLAYMLYRKYMFLRALDSGRAPGWGHTILNKTVAAGSLVAESLTHLFSGRFPSDPNEIGSWLYTVQQLGTDELSKKIDAVYKREHKRRPFASEKFPEDVDALAEAKIKTEGFQGRELGFFSALDSKFDRILLRNKGDKLLRKMGANKSSAMRRFWRGRTAQFIRRMLFFKMLPTYLYWKGKQWSGTTKKEFADYIPFKEAIKSIGYSSRLRVDSRLMDFLNRDMDETGRGFLDRVDDKTLGVFGPNLVSEGTRIGSRAFMVWLTNLFKEDFLTLKDYYPAHTDSKGKINVKKFAVRKISQHVTKSVSQRLLTSVIGKVRKPLLDRFGKKFKKFVKFLARRGWVGKSWASENTWMMLGVFPHYLAPLTYYFASGDSPIITDHDYERAMRIVMETRDPFHIIDTLLAGWIAEDIAEWGSRKVVGKMAQ